MLPLLRALLREPLVHFAVLGFCIYAVHRARAQSDVVVVDAARVLDAETRRTGAPVTEAEADAALSRHVTEELYFREALALGLEAGDPIVRRRLIQKFELMIDAESARTQPTESALEDHLRVHSKDYIRATIYSVDHVFLEAPDPAVLRRLSSGGDPRAEGRPFLRGHAFPSTDRAGLERIFGAAFADAALEETARWHGPVVSPFGVHYVRAEVVSPARVPEVDGVRVELVRDVRAAATAVHRASVAAELRQRYAVRVERALRLVTAEVAP